MQGNGTADHLMPGEFSVKCDGEAVQRVTSIVYLGMKLDQFLNFDDYVTGVCSAAKNRLSFLYRYSSRTIKLLCTSLVMSKLSYYFTVRE